MLCKRKTAESRFRTGCRAPRLRQGFGDAIPVISRECNDREIFSVARQDFSLRRKCGVARRPLRRVLMRQLRCLYRLLSISCGQDRASRAGGAEHKSLGQRLGFCGPLGSIPERDSQLPSVLGECPALSGLTYAAAPPLPQGAALGYYVRPFQGQRQRLGQQWTQSSQLITQNSQLATHPALSRSAMPSATRRSSPPRQTTRKLATREAIRGSSECISSRPRFPVRMVGRRLA